MENLTESIEYVKVLKTSDGDHKIEIFSNQHAKTSIKTQSKFSRVGIYEILDSISEIKDVLYEKSMDILKTCETKCSLLVVENILGFDYQLWLDEKKGNNLRLIINTSIYHPKNLRNYNYNTPTIVVTKNGDVVVKESIEYKVINNKVITFFNIKSPIG